MIQRKIRGEIHIRKNKLLSSIPVTRLTLLLGLGLVMMSGQGSWASSASEVSVELGRKLVILAGCNDCHTAGYSASGAKIPQKGWLMGSPEGWKGPWGTTYATNLRIYFDDLTEKEWLVAARSMEARPTMPNWILKEMDDSELRSIYRFVKKLKPIGKPAPDYLPPGKNPSPPYYELILPPPPK